MKKKYFSVLLTLLVFSVPFTYSQNAKWEPVYLLVTGGNTMDGVEASFRIDKCNNEDVVYIKFNNHNNYPVKLEWFDAIFTQELKWVSKDGENNKRSIVIPGKVELKGECANKNLGQLVVKISDFITDKKNFKRYHTSNLTIVSAE
jgi:hypothetical protein